MPDPWVIAVETAVKAFASQHRTVYRLRERQVFAAFEIGCFLSLFSYYERLEGCVMSIENTIDGEFRYLTTPSGNPSGFSYCAGSKGGHKFEIRQQVRIRSHIDEDICFTPDIVVLRKGTTIQEDRFPEYASGKRRFFCVNAEQVIAAHECKSLNPFPELLVSFLGLLMAGHKWLGRLTELNRVSKTGFHLAPTLFVGGVARGFQKRTVEAFGRRFPLNIVLGMHSGTWDLLRNKAGMIRIDLQ